MILIERLIAGVHVEEYMPLTEEEEEKKEEEEDLRSKLSVHGQIIFERDPKADGQSDRDLSLRCEQFAVRGRESGQDVGGRAGASLQEVHPCDLAA